MDKGTFYLDQEKDVLIDLSMDHGVLSYVLRTPYHKSGNLITNLAKLCGLPLSIDETTGLKVIRGVIPCYLDAENKAVYILRLGDTKVANIYPNGVMERKAMLPAIAKTLMSQTKDYRLSLRQTLVKSYVLQECKFHTDLHAHMNANLPPDLLIALGIHHQIRYPLYYIRKLSLRLSPEQEQILKARREQTAKEFLNSSLTGKYLQRRIDDNTCINLARLILENPENAAYNIPRIRASLAILKDGQAVFTNLEEVYLYRYVFTKGVSAEDQMEQLETELIPDHDIRAYLRQMEQDRKHPVYRNNTLFEDKLLWMARNFARYGVSYAEISDTALLKHDLALKMLAQIHRIMPTVTRETGVLLRFLAGFRRIPLTIIKDQPAGADLEDQFRTFCIVISDPYVAGSDIIGEEMNDIRTLRPLLSALTHIARDIPGFVMRIHAGENDNLRGNVRNSIQCVIDSLEPGQQMPALRIGHGLYTENLHTKKGAELLQLIRDSGAVLEFQITSNVRLNNLSVLKHHPLKEYLAAGIPCVQGTDGAGIYGTNSIDEQLSLERMLFLTTEEMKQMRRTEDRVAQFSLQAFEEKSAAQDEQIKSDNTATASSPIVRFAGGTGDLLHQSESLLEERIRPLPEGKLPVVIVGGSFGGSSQSSRLRPDVLQMLNQLVQRADPEKVFFVLGNQLAGYEKCLADIAGSRFDVFAYVPAAMTVRSSRRILKSGVSVRVSIEAAALGLYKSFSYEIFKRRPSVLLALSGRSPCANMIQEAKNGAQKAQIFADARCQDIRKKADSLDGYVKLFKNGKTVMPQVLAAIDAGWSKMNGNT